MGGMVLVLKTQNCTKLSTKKIVKFCFFWQKYLFLLKCTKYLIFHPNKNILDFNRLLADFSLWLGKDHENNKKKDTYTNEH